jgi:glycosyltransferase involved in cell wall biosynthesis
VYSSHHIKKFNEIFDIPVEKICFIPFCVDDEYFKPQKLDSYDYISSVGKDIGRDYPTLLKAIEGLSCNVKIVCGSNLDNTILPQNAGKLVNVPYLKVREIYSKSKFVVLPLHCNRGSDAAGQTALLEAMAMGKAVVASRSPSLLDYVDNWKTGIFVKPYDAKDMKSAIQYLLDNPEEADKIGKNARKAVEDKFNHKIYAKNLASLMWRAYENALD